MKPLAVSDVFHLKTSTQDPYDSKPSSGPEADEKLRYGNISGYSQSHSTGDDVSKPEDGPEGATKGGHKPEGRS